MYTTIINKKGKLRLTPLDATDEILLSEILKLEKDGDRIVLIRHDEGDSFYLESE